MPDTPLAPIAEDPARYALFLDIDGCLIDLAETPDGITVPPDLTDTLARLSERMGGALALVTGRKTAWVDKTFAPLLLPLAGLHGVERRGADGRIAEFALPEGMDIARARLAGFAEIPGMVVEDKEIAIALHYRQAPDREPEAEIAMTGLLREIGTGWELQRGKKVIELRPSGASKGAAVRAFLQEAPFAGRLPVTIGDDVTDETMFPVANELGGISIRIGDPAEPTEARAHLPTPEALRTALREALR